MKIATSTLWLGEIADHDMNEISVDDDPAFITEWALQMVMEDEPYAGSRLMEGEAIFCFRQVDRNRILVTVKELVEVGQ